MKKDIFVDNNIAKNFSNPLSNEYKYLIKWLIAYDGKNLDSNAHLVVSNKLINEYWSSARMAKSSTSMPAIIDSLTKQGRLIKFSNKELNEFRSKFFKKRIVKSLRSNKKDWFHICLVLLSHRKLAITLDGNLIYDLVNFPGFQVNVAKSPSALDYS